MIVFQRVIFLQILLITISNGYNITIIQKEEMIKVTNDEGIINQNFISNNERLTCIMPKLYVFNDSMHQIYTIVSFGDVITSVVGKYLKVGNVTNYGNSVTLNNGCQGDGKNQMNWIVVELGDGTIFEYLVNCNPNLVYKPFEWGLFILIFFSTVTITVSSFYSRAWSYRGFGFNVSKKIIIIFNLMIIVVAVFLVYFPKITGIWLKIVGSSVGTMGVAVCTSQTLWLLKNKKLNENRIGFIRFLDIISFIVGGLITGLYWLSNGIWFINDILAVCTIIAGIKLLKIRSLKNGIFILYMLLIFWIFGSLVVKYVFKESYNNLVIRLLESPLIIVFPSITPEFERKCSWMPISNILFPGLVISYLRRFDKSRGTVLYLMIGYGSFYLGSILFMIADRSTTHTLPFGIISDIMITVIVFIFAYRRNEINTIWNGLFYDTELPDFQENVLPSKSGEYIAFQDMTQSLKIQKSAIRSVILDSGEI